MSIKKGLGFYLKTLFSLLLLYYVFGKVGWNDLWKELKRADLYYLTLYICLDLFMTLVSAIKWSVLIKPQGIHASLPRLYLLYMFGYFFNNILPTSVGGDVVRAYELGKFEGKQKEAMASVFVERFTGLTILILFALLSVSLDPRFLRETKVVVPLALALGGYLGIVAVVFNRSSVFFMEKLVPAKIVGRLLKKVEGVQTAIYMYKNHKRSILYAMGYSIVFYVSSVLLVSLGCLVFDFHVSLAKLSLAVPIMLVLFMMPISIGGIGLQEWAYYFVMGMVGVPGAVGLSLGLLGRTTKVVMGLLGGAMYSLFSSYKTSGTRELVRQNARSDLLQ